MVGKQYADWTIIGPAVRQEDGQARFPCRCVCGTERAVLFRSLGRVSLSCGCRGRAKTVARRTTHGGSKEPLFRVWGGMKTRCQTPSATGYENYGGRGIKVCEEWSDYAVFREWALANGYAKGLDLDRRDNDGPYSPENCRFTTRSSNLRNTRTNRLLTAWGETKSVSAWLDDDRCAVQRGTLYKRLQAGWAHEDALGNYAGR